VKQRIRGEYGLPKFAVEELRVTEHGAEGDYNNYRMTKQAGDPNQAILVLTDDVIRQLNAEGWPVQPGDLGENLTLGGIAESSLQVGTRLQLGEVCLEITLRCDPCTELYTLPYLGEERGPEFVRTTVDRRGWYARVIASGVIRPDTPVEVMQRAGGVGA
jgi:MOSC domain-containing protein YiiM